MRKTFRKRYKSRNHLLGNLWFGDYKQKHWWEIYYYQMKMVGEEIYGENFN